MDKNKNKNKNKNKTNVLRSSRMKSIPIQIADLSSMTTKIGPIQDEQYDPLEELLLQQQQQQELLQKLQQGLEKYLEEIQKNVKLMQQLQIVELQLPPSQQLPASQEIQQSLPEEVQKLVIIKQQTLEKISEIQIQLQLQKLRQ